MPMSRSSTPNAKSTRDGDSSSEYSPTTHSYIPGTRPKRSLFQDFMNQHDRLLAPPPATSPSLQTKAPRSITFKASIPRSTTPQEQSSDGVDLDSSSSCSSVVARLAAVQLTEGGEGDVALLTDQANWVCAPENRQLAQGCDLPEGCMSFYSSEDQGSIALSRRFLSKRRTTPFPKRALDTNRRLGQSDDDFMILSSSEDEKAAPSTSRFQSNRTSTPNSAQAKPVKTPFQTKLVIRNAPGTYRRRILDAIQRSNQTTATSKLDNHKRSAKVEMYKPIVPSTR